MNMTPRAGVAVLLAAALTVTAWSDADAQPSPGGEPRAPAATDATVRIYTALPVTYSIASALARGTGIVVANVPQEGRRLGLLASLFERRPERYEGELAAAQAVVTIDKLWLDDPLYAAARAANIRVVDIDATKPWNAGLEGIAVAMEPVDDVPWAADSAEAGERVPSVYFWLGPANGARSAEIVARDLMRLAPGQSARIEQNLIDYRTMLLDLKRAYELDLATLPDITVLALAPEFVYLTNELGVYVDGYFLKQDIDWTEQDLEALRTHLKERDIGVVIHKWEPDAPIAAAVAAGGAELVVLDPIDLGIVEEDRVASDGYERLLRSNLEALYQALRRANEPD